MTTDERDWPYEAHQRAEHHLAAVGDRADNDFVVDFGVCESLTGPAEAAQLAAEEHLGRCLECLFCDEQDDSYTYDDYPAVGPFCGCDTCEVRETLAAAWPHIEAAVRDGVRELQPPASSFDGCSVCVTREVIVGAWPVVVAAVDAQFELPDELTVS